MKPTFNKILAYEVWMNDGQMCGRQINDVQWYMKNVNRDRCIEISGKKFTYLLYTDDVTIEYKTALGFAIAHHKGLMQELTIDLSSLNQQAKLGLKRKKNPPTLTGGWKK